MAQINEKIPNRFMYLGAICLFLIMFKINFMAGPKRNITGNIRIITAYANKTPAVLYLSLYNIQSAITEHTNQSYLKYEPPIQTNEDRKIIEKKTMETKVNSKPNVRLNI